MYQRSDIKEGMTVRSADGHKLGKVYAVGDLEFHIEKGLFFPKDYAVRYAEISELRHGDIILAHGMESLRFIPDENDLGTTLVTPGEPLRTQDLGDQPIGPHNTEGARASPILTEEDRGVVTTPIRRERVRTTRRDMTDRPSMRASGDEPMSTTVNAEKMEARRRAMVDESEEEAHRRVTETRGDAPLEGTRTLNFTPDDPNKRGS